MVDAMVRVADIYREGDAEEGVEPNSKAALRLYTAAASYGHPSAHFGRGVMSLEGNGIKADPAKALRWLTEAAKKRYPPAEALLGELRWEGGKVVKRDRTEALKWYMLATQSARPEEYPGIFDRYNVLASQVDDEQLREAEGRAREWAEKFPLPPPPHGGMARLTACLFD